MDALGELLIAAWVHHHIGDAAHQIFAEADLRVHRADRGEDIAGHEVAEIGGDGGRADVEGNAEDALRQAGEDRHDVAPLRTAAVAFQPPARSVFCRPPAMARSAVASARPHCSASASCRRRKSLDGSRRFGSRTST